MGEKNDVHFTQSFYWLLSKLLAIRLPKEFRQEPFVSEEPFYGVGVCRGFFGRLRVPLITLFIQRAFLESLVGFLLALLEGGKIRSEHPERGLGSR